METSSVVELVTKKASGSIVSLSGEKWARICQLINIEAVSDVSHQSAKAALNEELTRAVVECGYNPKTHRVCMECGALRHADEKTPCDHGR
jgi:hypothetical protein